MKKLMITAAIVCAAVFAHGAQFYWGINNSSIMGPGTEADGYVDGDGYLLDGIATLIIAGDPIASIDHITDGDWTFGPLYTEKVTDETGTLSDLPRGTIDDYEQKAFQIVLTTPDGKYQTVFDDFSHIEEESAGAGEPGYNYEAFVTLKDAGAWTEVGGGDDPSGGVPEPTSGLLLLVGLAGMALKRKIA